MRVLAHHDQVVAKALGHQHPVERIAMKRRQARERRHVSEMNRKLGEALALDFLRAEAVAADRARGLLPFLVVASAGTTNTGAVDPMDAVADLRARDGLWMHVDGAYGAFFHLSEKLRPLLPGMSRADSLTLDPHKGLFLPYGTGALLVRDGDEGQGDLTPRLCQPCRFLCKGQLTAERADRWSPEPQPGEVRFYKKHYSTRAHDVPTSSLSQSP